MKIELPDPAGNENVVSIEVARNRSTYARLLDKKCAHWSVLIDPPSSELECQDCHAKLNATEWLAEKCEHWNHYMADGTKRYHAAKEAAEQRMRTVCQHCKKMTKITRLKIAL